MAPADIELIIARAPGERATASLRVELPARRSDLAVAVPTSLDDAGLRALSASPEVYGAALTAMVFPAALREAWQRARGFAEGAGHSLRVRLALQGDDGLHAIRWELLRDPLDNAPLAYGERVRLSRFMAAPSLAELRAPARPDLRAAVAVASPAALTGFGLPPLDVAGETARALAGLGDIPTTIIDGREGRPAATLPAIAEAIRAGPQILSIVCHGALRDGSPYLWLEREDEGRYQPVPGDELAQLIERLERRPLLILLASCQGAGDTYAVLAAIGPRLARAGVGAVIAMQGDVPAELVAALTPRLFAELRRDGQIDRALAAARAALPAASDWWKPTLWMAVRDGALWRDPGPDPDAERRARLGEHVQDQRAFIQSWLERFVGRAAELAELRRLMEELRPSGGYLIVSAQAGQGKSSLLARLIADEGALEEPADGAYHFIPFDPGPEYQASILRNLLARLALRHGLAVGDLKSIGYAALRDAFARALQELSAGGGHATLYIDGLDQLPLAADGARDLSFLPQRPPAGVVIVLGTRSDDTLQQLAPRQPQRPYPLPPLSPGDFAELLARQKVVLPGESAERLYTALQASPLYLDLAARELALAPATDLSALLASLGDDPQNLFEVSIGRLRRARAQWKQVIKPILGALLVTRRSLSRAALQRLLDDVGADEVQEGLERLGGLILRDRRGGYTLYHLRLREYLREDPARPGKRCVFSADEERERHGRLAAWCAPEDPAIWEDVSDPAEQERREHARRQSVYHLARAGALDRLWALLDRGSYVRSKLRYDPSTHNLALDLDEARLATVSGAAGSYRLGLGLLPRLWRYSLLRAGLTGRADRYPQELFVALVELGRAREAAALANLVSDGRARATCLCAIGAALRGRGDMEWARTTLLRAAEVAREGPEGQRQSLLAPIIDELARLGDLAAARGLAGALPLQGRAILGARSQALARLAAAAASAEGVATAQALVAELPEPQRDGALAEAVRILAEEGGLAEARAIGAMIAGGSHRALAELAIAGAEVSAAGARGDHDGALRLAAAIAPPHQRDRALKEAARAAAWAGQPVAADALAAAIDGAFERARALSGIAARSVDPARTEAARAAALGLAGDDRERALGGLAVDLAAAGRGGPALEALEAIESSHQRTWAAAQAARRLIAAGAVEPALRCARLMLASLPDSWRRDLGAIVEELVRVGQAKAAEALLGELAPEERVWSQAVLGLAYARAGRQLAAAEALGAARRTAATDARRAAARDLTCRTVAEALASVGQLQAALRAAEGIGDAQERGEAQIAALLLAREPERLLALAAALPANSRRAVTLSELARALAQRGQLAPAAQLIETIEPGYQRDAAAFELAAAHAAQGQRDQAEALAAGLDDLRFRAKAHGAIAAALGREGDAAGAERALAAAHGAADAIPDAQAGLRDEARAAIAGALAGIGWLDEALQLAETLPAESFQWYELTPPLIRALVRAGRSPEARQLALAQQRGHPRDEALAALCRALAAAGDLAGAQDAANEMGTEGARLRRQQAILAGLLDAGRLDEALALVGLPPLAGDIPSLCAAALALGRVGRTAEAAAHFDQAAQVTMAPFAAARRPALAAALAAALGEAGLHARLMQHVQAWWLAAQTSEELLALLPAAAPLLAANPELGPALIAAYDEAEARLTEIA